MYHNRCQKWDLCHVDRILVRIQDFQAKLWEFRCNQVGMIGQSAAFSSLLLSFFLSSFFIAWHLLRPHLGGKPFWENFYSDGTIVQNKVRVGSRTKFSVEFLGELYGSLPFSVGRRNIQTTAPSAEIRNWESEKGCKSSSTWEAVTSSSILKNTGKHKHCGNQTFQLSLSKSHGKSENLEIARQFH